MKHNTLIASCACLLIGASACNTTTDQEPVQATSVQPTATTPSQPQPTRPGAGLRPDFVASKPAPVADAPTWRWRAHLDGQGVERHRVIVPPANDTPGLICELTFEKSPDKALVTCHESSYQGASPRKLSKLWSHELDSRFVDAGDLLAHQGRLFVAHHSAIASGAKVFAYNLRTGALIWEKQLQANGPVDHSKYRNEVQLSPRAHHVLTYGRESGGSYIEVLDARTGALVANHGVDPTVTEISWHEPIPKGPQSNKVRGDDGAIRATGVADGYDTLYKFDPGTRRLIKLDDSYNEAWSHQLEVSGDVELLEVEKTLFLLAGDTLQARETSTGKTRWLAKLPHTMSAGAVSLRKHRDVLSVYRADRDGAREILTYDQRSRLVSTQTITER